MQQLLRQALDSSPQAIYGLLAGHGHTVEAVLALHGKPGTDDIEAALYSWREKALRPIACYSSEGLACMHLAGWPDKLASHISNLPRLIIRTDTKGRIEAKLLSSPTDTTADETRSFPLEMQEDGGLGLYPLEDKG